MNVQKMLAMLMLFALCLPLLAQNQAAIPSLEKIESIYQEENEPIIFILSASGIDNRTVWQLVGTTLDGTLVSVSPISVSKLKSGSWQLVFPGQAQGSYYVHATDENGNQSVLSDALNVTEHSPVVVGVTPREIDPQKSFTLAFAGNYIQTDDKVELIADADGKTVAGAWQVPKNQKDQKDQNAPKDQKASSGLQATFPGMAPGVYTVLVTSAKQKTARLPSALKVFKPAPDLSRFAEQSSLRVARIYGGNWTDAMKAFLAKGDKRHEVSLFGQTDTDFSVVYKNDLDPGMYDLIIVNNEGKESTLKNVLEVKADASAFPCLWLGGGVNIAYVNGSIRYEPSITANWALVHKLGFSLGYEGGLSYLVQFPDNANKSSFWFSEWMGYTLRQLNGLETMTVRVPVGLKFIDELSFPYTGVFLDYELGKKWIAEIGYEYDLLADGAPYSSSLHLTALKQF